MHLKQWHILVLAASALGCNSDRERIARLEKQNQQLTAKLEAATKKSNLELQRKCAEQARQVFRDDGWSTDKMAGYVNHYNATVGKCFVQLSSISSPSKPPVPTVYKSVLDAFEGKRYAEYFWANHGGELHSEVPPVICKVTTLSGADVYCKSETEFDSLITQFVE